MTIDANAPIGGFDSGVGGLSVALIIRELLPHEDILYVADSHYVPYGQKSQAFLIERAHSITEHLISQGAKAIVIACNTATAAAAKSLRATYAVPIIGMEPAVKPAVLATKNGVVGVLATSGTLDSSEFAGLLERFTNPSTDSSTNSDTDKTKVITQPCPQLPEQVDAGEVNTEKTYALLKKYCAPLIAAKADVIVLGCTHYPFLKDQIQDIVGKDIILIDTGLGVARRLKAVLKEQNLLSSSKTKGSEFFWTSGECELVKSVIEKLWNQPVNLRKL